ncbi:hypothetical protein RDWZM_002769 [Blomia tropicalis]|uniref:SHSP domain-containing protein n=1 Tax=Blomia tropicalis TaxID=40697 RepID=A0A9Q0MES7_BLOTA|nr:hypothetical protein RDWZM_002769 [Blomia tropicalis]
MAHSISSFESLRPNFSEKVENFFRTTENIYSNKLGGGLFNGNRMAFPRDMFELFVEVPNYKPEEVSVSTQDDLIIITGKREETHPQYGYQSKEFTNKYTLPKNIDKSKMTCVFKDRGFLKIEAPLIKQEEPNTRTIPIKIISDQNSQQQQSSTSKTSSSASVTTNGTSVSHV